jgi:hypothetical protein
MSATIKYVRVKNAGKSLPVYAPSRFIGSLERAFGCVPCEIGPSDVPILRGMAAVADEQERKCYEILIKEIGEDSQIKVWAEY